MYTGNIRKKDEQPGCSPNARQRYIIIDCDESKDTDKQFIVFEAETKKK
jgi:hypothetical protein